MNKQRDLNLQSIYSTSVVPYLFGLFRGRIFDPTKNAECLSSNFTSKGNFTIDYIGAADDEPFFLVSFLLTIVEKIMCDLGLTISWVSINEGYYFYENLILDPIPIGEGGAEAGDFVSTEQVYMLEIMTPNRFKPSKYFSFFFLFKTDIWICLIFAAIVNIIFWKMTNEHQVNLGTGIGVVFRSLVSQPIGHINHLIKNKSRYRFKRVKKTVFLLLFGIWLNMGGVLQRCITSVLLNTYLESKPEARYPTLASIAQDKNVKIAIGEVIYIIENDVPLHEMVQGKRLNDTLFPTKADDFGVLKTIKEVIEGKAVILDSSYGMRQKERLAKDFDDWIVSDEKYIPTYITFYANKKIPSKKQILHFIQRGVDAGLYWHYRLSETLRTDFVKRMFKKYRPRLYNSLVKTEQNEFALHLHEIWANVLLVLILGYIVSFIVFIIEPVYYLKFQQSLEERVQGAIKLHSARNSILHKFLNNRKPFVKRAKRLKSLSFEPKEVHKKLLTNYRLYFEKH